MIGSGPLPVLCEQDARARHLAETLGICAPHGRAPLYLRLMLRLNRTAVTNAAARFLAFGPDRVIFTQGHWFDRQAGQQLRASFAWLLGPADAPKHLGRRQFEGIRVVITGASSGIGRTTALAFARRGASVVVGRRVAGPQEAAGSGHAQHGRGALVGVLAVAAGIGLVARGRRDRQDRSAETEAVHRASP